MRIEDLRGDCERCAGLCCVVPAFTASADFAVDKPAGQPCRNLIRNVADLPAPGYRCGIHDHLRTEGFVGCTVYDCFGAGQRVTQVTFGGGDWRSSPEIAPRMFAAFEVMRDLHELLWYLAQALDLAVSDELRPALRRVRDDIEDLTRSAAPRLSRAEVDRHWRRADELLARTSERVRVAARPHAANRRRADLVGAKLRDADLAGADLRGAYLIGADLTGADLRWADLIGADLRAANLGGADLSTSLFVTQPQVQSAKGDRGTRLPDRLRRPVHWLA